MTDSSEKNIWHYTSLVISYFVHPVFVPTYIFTLFLYFGNFIFEPYSLGAQVYVVGLIFITTAIIPLVLLAINMLLQRKKISNDTLLMDSRGERVVPFFYMGAYYSTLSYMFFTYLNFPVLLTCLMIIVSVSVLVTAIINLFWKISAHSIALGASVMTFILIDTVIPNEHLFYVIIGTLLISGITISSRLYLNAHTTSQTYVGFLLGMLVSAIGLYFLLPNFLYFPFNL